MTSTLSVQSRGATNLAVRINGGLTQITTPHSSTTVLQTIGGPPGPRGPMGDSALPAIKQVAEVAMTRGTPVAVNRATGKFRPADAAIYNLAFVVGLLNDDTAAGFQGSATAIGMIKLAGLLPGQLYYLREGGGVTTTRPTNPGSSVVVIGEAISSTTLDIRRTPPVLL